MKLILTLCLVFMCSVGWSQTEDISITTPDGESIECTYLFDPDIEELAESGKICEVYGHWWETYSKQECYEISQNGDCVIGKMVPDEQSRICRICQKKQVWKEGWEDEN